MSPAYTNATVERAPKERIDRLRKRFREAAPDDNRALRDVIKGVLDLLEDEL
jgi:hypothetical protein